MRILRGVTIVLAMAGMAAAAPPELSPAPDASDEDSAVLEQEVRRLVTELGSDTRAARTAAEKRLLELGPDALPHLPASELLPTLSVREAVRRVRVELERTKARLSVQASRVTLVKEKSLSEAFAEMTGRTGNGFDARALPENVLAQPAGIDAEAVPYWQALDELCARHRLKQEYDAAARGVKLYPLPRGAPPADSVVVCAGAFRVEAPPAERTRRKTPQRRDRRLRTGDDLVRVTLSVQSEPRLRPLYLQYAAGDITARSGEKTSLSPLSPEANYDQVLTEGSGPSRIQLDYLLPASTAAPSLELTGKLTFTTAAGRESIRFADLLKAREPAGQNVSRRRGGVTVTLNRLKTLPSSPGKLEARIAVSVAYDAGGPAFESHRTWILHNEVYLVDAAGKRVKLNGGSETAQQGDGTLGIEYRFVDLPDPLPAYTFVYVAPTLIVDVPVEFEIQSIPVRNK